MSHLPDDLRRWPNDPFQLLGVTRNTSPRDLKRAYTQLIRLYKPEHAPEEFRRIRAAYDSARQFIELFGGQSRGESPPPLEREATAPPDAGPPETAPPHDDDARHAPPPRPLAMSLDERLDECWQWAVDGDEAKAYQTLLRLHVEAPGNARVGVRLYWLLALVPQLDRDRTACDWLVACSRRGGFTGPLRELYRRELVASPDEARSARCAELIDALPPATALLELIEWRWRSVGQAGEATEVIRDDLARLRERFLAADEEAWARLVFTAIGQAAYCDTPSAHDLMTLCRRELASLEHLHLRLAADFDHCDLVRKIAAQSRPLLRGAPWRAELAALVRASWVAPIETLRPRLASYLAAVAARPRKALQEFDAVCLTASSLLIQFRRCLSSLDALAQTPDDLRDAGEVEELALSFVRDAPGVEYDELRLPLFDFCLREAIMPERVAAALAGYDEFRLSDGRHLSRALTGDLPLGCVCHACRLSWY